MMTGLLIAIAAGCASALMFASIVSGALISLVLFYLAPMPLMLAAIGWGPTGAAIGCFAAALGLGALFGLPYLGAFLLMVGLPAWWLGHLVLLGRPLATARAGESARGTPPTPDVEWYPLGRILLWIAGFAALTTSAALLTLGSDGTSIMDSLRHGLARILAAETSSKESAQVVSALAAMAPAAAATITTLTLTLNLWLASYVAATSGRLRRPWPLIRSLTLPPMTLVALFVALAFCFGGGLIAIVAQIVSSALLLAYAMTGFAVLHTITLAMKTRALLLSSAYAVVMVFGWPALAMIGLGLADALFGIRQRYLQRRPPPATAS
jgi:hypothetical protein